MNNFNDKKINKPVGVGSEVLIGGKIDNQHSNVVVDETPELIGLPKSSAELAEELIDYLVTHNHQKAAKIIIEEARIYLSKLSNNNIFNMVLCARYTSPPLRQMRSPLYTNFFVSYCHPPF